MKDLGMMHYVLAWRCGQGKYVVEILKRFRIMDCKAMTTPMELNLKLLSVASLESLESTVSIHWSLPPFHTG